jgi:hypothetical protein
MSTKMGFEGFIYLGTKGSTAATLLTNTRDINYNLEPDKGDTTVRGLGTSPPIKTERVVMIGVTIDWTMLNKTNDTNIATLLTAVTTGNEVAIRTKDHSAGKGFDGDCTISVQQGRPIGGEQTLQFTATPSDELRTPALYV